MKITLRILFLILCLSSAVFAEGKVIVRIDLKAAGIQANQLPRSLDVAGQDLKKSSLDLVVTEEEFADLEAQGIPMEIVMEQTQGLDSKYLNYEKITALISELKAEFTEIVHVVEIGKSLQGRPIYAVRISSPENVDQKPAILFNGMHHAREVMTTEITTDIMKYLTSGYETDEVVRAWVDHLAIWIIPQLNPDGNNIVWTEDNWWRKNARGDEGSFWGVDLNRNYPFQWNACGGSSGDTNDQTYRGASPGSEPETKAITSFFVDQNFAFDISYHSYSEMVVAPYGCQNQYAPENFIFKHVGQALASKIVSDSGRGGYAYGTGWELLYPVDGEDISWMYNETGAIAYVIEVSSSKQGFQPSYSKWRDSTVKRNRAGWQYLLNYLLAGSQVRGFIKDAQSGSPIDATMKIVGVKYESEKPRRSKQAYFQKILVPGSYELEFSAPGYATEVVAVSVGSEAVNLDVELQKSDAWLLGL